MSDNFFLVIENNYSELNNNYNIFNSGYKTNEAFLNLKNLELKQHLGIDIFHCLIEHNKFLNFIWAKYISFLDDKKKIKMSIEAKILEKNSKLIQEQHALITDLKTENKNLKKNLEKILRKLISKNTKFDIAENLYYNNNSSKLDLNIKNILTGKSSNNNSFALNNLKSKTESESYLHQTESNSRSKSKSKTKQKSNFLCHDNKPRTISKQNEDPHNEKKNLNAINNSVNQSKSPNEETSNNSLNERTMNMQMNLNEFIERISSEGVINKSKLVKHKSNKNNKMINQGEQISNSVNFLNNDEINHSQILNKSHNVELYRDLNILSNESESHSLIKNNKNKNDKNSNNSIAGLEIIDPKNSLFINDSNRKLNKNFKHANFENFNYDVNIGNQTSRYSYTKTNSLLKSSQSVVNFNEISLNRKQKESDDLTNLKISKKDLGIKIFLILI